MRILLKILDELSRHELRTRVPEDILSAAESLFQTLEAQLPTEKRSRLKGVQGQLVLITMKSPRYLSHLIVVACLLFTISPDAYENLRHAGAITLPHPSTVRRRCSSCDLSPQGETDGNFLLCTKKRIKHLQLHEKTKSSDR